MDPRSQETRHKLATAARQLFAERGVAAVSLREITRAAGQANVNALQYHFGDREQLLFTVLDPHQREVDSRRNALLDEIEARGAYDLRDLGAALVRPPAALLHVAEGRETLRIMSELVRHPDRFASELTGFRSSLGRWRRLAGRLMSDGVRPLHRRFAAILLAHGELAARAEANRPGDQRLFVSNLIDLATGVLATPASAETASLLGQRGPRRRAPR